MDQEASAFLAELKVNIELGYPKVPKFHYVDGSQAKEVNLKELIVYDSSGKISDSLTKNAIARILSQHTGAVLDENGRPAKDWKGSYKTHPLYSVQHLQDYSVYRSNFKENRQNLKAKNWLNRGF